MEELKRRAASLYYHGAKEIRMSEAEFVEAFVSLTHEGQLSFVNDQWHFYGLLIIKTGTATNGH